MAPGFVRRSAHSRNKMSKMKLAAVTALCVMQSVLHFARAASGAEQAMDLTLMPLERLMAMEVVSASKFPQRLTEAPASVTVVTAADIRDYGHRTLADILRSIRGLYVSYDRNYSYLGVRGFSRPGDYNTRVLLLVDGYRFNDNVYDQASIGSEFPIDVDLIERVEFVPGPGSSVYGSNAFFGVVNVITRRGADIGGGELAGAAGSGRSRTGRATYGRRLENGADLLLSVSDYRSRGKDLFYPELIPLGAADGMARGLDGDRTRQLFARYAYRGWTLAAVRGEREKDIPTAAYGTVPGMAGTRTRDGNTYLDLKYSAAPSVRTEVTARLYYGHYTYHGDYIYDAPPLYRNRDSAHGEWWGAEARVVSSAIERHKLVAGAEYQRDLRQRQMNFDERPYALYLDDRRDGDRAGLYLQDEVTLHERLRLNAGLRYDRAGGFGGIFNPRLALIAEPFERTHLKLLYGTAYRAPNVYERFYFAPGAGGQKANPGLRPERIRTYEFAAEHFLHDGFRLGASVFRYHIRDHIDAMVDPADGLAVFRNIDGVRASGFGVEAEHLWSWGARLRASYTRQNARDASGSRLSNSPRHLAKLNFTAPLPGGWLRAGAELQYTSSRRTLAGDTGGFWLANLNLVADRLAPGLEMSLGLYNLFDRHYADPGGGEHVQDAIPQDGRSLRLKLRYRF